MTTIVNSPKQYRPLFEIREDKSILLWVTDSVAVPFRDLKEWETFANDMLGMIPEMKENGLSDE